MHLDLDKLLAIVYWLPKMHKTPIGDRYIIASKTCSRKQQYPISDTIFKVLNKIFNTVERFHSKILFYSGCKKIEFCKILFQLSLS